MISYVTDLEGRWDKLADFARDHPAVTLDERGLRVADGATFVFGGDAVDRGPAGQKMIATLLDAREAQPDRVVLLAGNRDLNKLRLARELTGAPPGGAPTDRSRGEVLRWILAQTMGAKDAFEHRRAELAGASDDAVVDSYLADVEPDGPVTRFLAAASLGHRIGETLFLHGGITAENFGVVPGIAGRAPDVDTWLARLAAFLADGVHAFVSGRSPDAVIAYQAPLPGTKLHQASVIYARPTDERGDPVLPPAHVIAWLRASAIRRVVVGHTPSGDTPAILRDGDFELVLADNSYGRIEPGSRVTIAGDALHVSGRTSLDGGAVADVAWSLAPGDSSPLGLRDRASRRLVKARLASGAYLTFRALDGFAVEQRAVEASDLPALGPPR